MKKRMDASKRRRFSTVIVTSLGLILFFLPLFSGTVVAQDPADIKLSVRIEGRGNEDATLFLVPDQILIASVPILVNVTFVNNDTVFPQPHNWRTDIGGVPYQTADVLLGNETSLEFWINETGEFPYWCHVPGHRDAGMEGLFIVGLAPLGPAEELGLPLRAYWIGVIGIFAMIAVIIVSYFVIKYESRHHTDHQEHRRRGLP